MPELKCLSIFLASPSDVVRERQVFREVVRDLNAWVARPLGLSVVVVGWEQVAPGCGEPDVQSRIDAESNLANCDLLVGIFWKKFGTPDPSGETPTEHEITLGLAHWRSHRNPQVMLYFSQEHPRTQTAEDAAQLQALLQFKRKVRQQGVWTVDYEGQMDFERQVRNHLSKYLLDTAQPAGQEPDTSLNVTYSISSLPVVLRKGGASERSGDIMISLTRVDVLDRLSLDVDVHLYTNVYLTTGTESNELELSARCGVIAIDDPQAGKTSTVMKGRFVDDSRTHIVFTSVPISFDTNQAMRTLRISSVRLNLDSATFVGNPSGFVQINYSGAKRPLTGGNNVITLGIPVQSYRCWIENPNNHQVPLAVSTAIGLNECFSPDVESDVKLTFYAVFEETIPSAFRGSGGELSADRLKDEMTFNLALYTFPEAFNYPQVWVSATIVASRV